MTAQEENELLTQTGRGTPCGELLRRYWQPAVLSEELTADKPLPVTIFGEELIMFRDGAGKPALIGRYCAHQGVDMVYGCVEPDGLRCLYHGWLFDNCGKVVLRGDWLPEKERRWDVGQPAYPCVEVGGVILAYMGPGEVPPLAGQELLAAQGSEGKLVRVMHEENFVQKIAGANGRASDGARFIMPNLVFSPNAQAGAELHWYVPVDDKSHVEFARRLTDLPASIGEPRDAAQKMLLEAIGKILAGRQMLSEPANKD